MYVGHSVLLHRLVKSAPQFFSTAIHGWAMDDLRLRIEAPPRRQDYLEDDFGFVGVSWSSGRRRSSSMLEMDQPSGRKTCSKIHRLTPSFITSRFITKG